MFIPNQPTIHYTESTLGLLFVLKTLKGHLSGFFTGEMFHNYFVVYGSCNIIFYGSQIV